MGRAEARPAQRTYDRSRMRNWRPPGRGELLLAVGNRCGLGQGASHPWGEPSLARAVMEVTGWAVPPAFRTGALGKGEPVPRCSSYCTCRFGSCMSAPARE